MIEVELRKATDTRAGHRLIIATLLITTATAISTLVSGPQNERTLDLVFGGTHYGLIMLSPILGVLAVTSEWSQRTTLTTSPPATGTSPRW